MSTEENKALVRRFIEEAYNKRNLAVVDELVASNHAWLGEFVRKVQGDWPDLRISVEDQVAEGDKVVTRWTARATHTLPVITAYGSMAPTNKQIAVPGISVDRIEGGKIVETWSNGDTLSEYQQLGAIPTPAQATD